MLRMIWRLVVYLLVLYSCCKLCFVIKCLSPPFHLSMSFALYLRHGCGKRMYHFEGRIMRRDGYHISRDVSHAVKVTIVEDRIVRRDRCTDRYVPHGSRTERQRVCIVKKDMHHDIWHCISWHCTFLLLINLNMCFADLVIVSLWSLWLLNMELLLRMCKLLECGYWVVCLVNC